MKNKIIIGLGNPGKEYEKTRHNVGFMFLDYISGSNSFSEEKKFNALIASTDDFVLIKPQTFMNDSGRSVRAYFDFYRIPIEPDNLIVVHDDLDIRFGEFKISDRGPKQHNGLLSIDQKLGIDNYKKIKIGVDNRSKEFKIPGMEYVLQRFTNEELSQLDNIFKEIKELL